MKIRSVFDVYSALKKYNVKYDDINNTMEYASKDYVVRLSNNNGDAEINISCGGNDYKRYFNENSFEKAYGFFKWLINGKISIEKDGKMLEVKNFYSMLNRYSRKRVGIVGRIIGTIIGVIFILFSASEILFYFLYFLHFIYDIDVYDVVLCGFFGLIMCYGISLIHHVFTETPISTGKAVGYFFGMVIIYFFSSLALMFCFTYDKEPRVPIVGTVLLTFFALLFVFCGIIIVRFALMVDKGDIYLFREIPFPNDENARALYNAVQSKITSETILIDFIDFDFANCYKSENKPDLFDSKIGGLPYWDKTKNFEDILDVDDYDPDEDDNTPFFIAQFNLERIPSNDFLPRKGMLQFFAYENDYEEGLEYKVVYHQNIDYSITEEQAEKMLEDKFSTISDEIRINLRKDSCSISPYSDIADKQMISAAEELGIDIDEDLRYYMIWEKCSENKEYKSSYFMMKVPGSDETLYEMLHFNVDKILPFNEYDDYCSLLYSCSVYIDYESLKNLDFDKAYTK